VTIMFEVPGPPVGKGRPRMTRTGHCYTPTKTAQYESKIAWCFQQAAPDHVPIKTAITLHVVAYMPIPASWSRKKAKAAEEGEIRPTVKPDLDNILKTLDALNGVAWKDDAQIVTAQVSKAYGEIAALWITIYWDEQEDA